MQMRILNGFMFSVSPNILRFEDIVSLSEFLTFLTKNLTTVRIPFTYPFLFSIHVESSFLYYDLAVIVSDFNKNTKAN